MTHLHSFVLFLLSFIALTLAIKPGIPSNGPRLDPRNIFEVEPEDDFDREDLDELGTYTGVYRRSLGNAWTGTTTLKGAGTTGVGGMQISVVDNDHILIFDKAENNPLQVNGHSAWGAIYTISTQKVRALNLQTNSFCAGGGWLSNGTLISFGGNPNEGTTAHPTSQNGLQAVRFFTPCGEGTCDVLEYPSRITLTSRRWYPSSTRLTDGSLLIAGGMIAGGFNNQKSTNNPTYEFFPPKGNGLPIHSQFLVDSLNTNLFPLMFTLPDGTIFVGANEMAMIYNWQTNTETRLPGIPNGVKITYPSSPAAVILPLTIANGFTPEVLICGGTSVNTDGNPTTISANSPGSNQCIRMVLNSAGIANGWQVESMPEARIMGDAVLTPDGKVFIVNGAGSGVAGYGNVLNEIGASNAANPVFRPTLYDPLAAAGSRFSTNFPSSSIERLYHSSATLLPDARILVTGSNPNDAVTTTTYATRYQVEIFSPPYVIEARPTYSALPANINYGTKYTLKVKIPGGTQAVTCVIMDLGYSTHGVHMDHRLVELKATMKGTNKLVITGPLTLGTYPPGYAWLYILADGVPSKGQRVMIGEGASPTSSQAATNGVLAFTASKTKKTG
jgi:hypothetical protein